MNSPIAAGTGPRIAIVGNMNNAGFAIMRYFRDLGADAYVLPYSTDGTGNLAHFAPEADTWEIDRWQPYIRPLAIPNTSEAILGSPHALRLPQRIKSVGASFAGYDYFIGSGVAPALFHRIGRRLDVFFPYSIGIEFYGDFEFMSRRRSSPIMQLWYDRLRRMQASGIRNARLCFNAEMSMTKASFEAIGHPFERLALPAVYNGPAKAAIEPPVGVKNILNRMAQSDLSLFSCARLMWVRHEKFTAQEWRSVTKNSDWMLHGLAQFVRATPKARPLLAIVEYGPDIEATKRLASELGLEDYILWLPKKPRREIMLLLGAADIGIGEFYIDPGVIWGGTGWEVLASGRPLIQSFNFTNDGFRSEFGHPAPQILDVKSSADFARHLEDMYASADARRALGQASLDWFNRYNGIGLARTWLERLASVEQAAAG